MVANVCQQVLGPPEIKVVDEAKGKKNIFQTILKVLLTLMHDTNSHQLLLFDEKHYVRAVNSSFKAKVLKGERCYQIKFK